MCNTLKYTRAIVLAAILCSGCKDIFEEDISALEIELLSPQNQALFSSPEVGFSWQENADIHRYRIQVARPSFSQISSLVHDSLVSESTINFVLGPGQYEWRVRGENAASSTIYSTRSFEIDSTSNLTGQTISIIQPVSQSVSNATITTLEWEALEFAQNYYVEIYMQIPENILVDGASLNQTSIDFELEEGKYRWTIFATNEAPSVSALTESNFTVDRTSPLNAILENPLNNAEYTDNQNITFDWLPSEDDWSNSVDSLIITTEANPDVVIYSEQATPPVIVLNNELNPGDYMWYIISRDEAGNESYSSSRYFSIQ
jgi:hypothetical protein